MKKIILVIMVLALMTVAACAQQEQTTATGFIGGTKGLELTFLAGAPPDSVVDRGEQDFDIVVDIKNHGESLVLASDAYVKISGFPPASFGVTNADLIKSPEDDLEPNLKNPDGSIINSPNIPVVFESLNYLQEDVATREFPIRAEICYKYTTNAAAELCVKDEFTRDRADDFCQVNAARKISTSGAPVQIISLKQSASGKEKTRFTFTVQNMDTGRVYMPDSDCEDRTTYENKVFVEVIDLTDSVSCVGLTGGSASSGYVTIPQGQTRDISCTVTMTDRNDRIEPFRLRLTYDYWKFIERKIIVQHSPE